MLLHALNAHIRKLDIVKIPQLDKNGHEIVVFPFQTGKQKSIINTKVTSERLRMLVMTLTAAYCHHRMDLLYCRWVALMVSTRRDIRTNVLSQADMKIALL